MNSRTSPPRISPSSGARGRRAGGRGRRGGGGGSDEAAFASERGVEAEIPRLLIVDTGAGLVEDDAGVGPDGAGEFIGEARGEERPFAAVGVADDADAGGIDGGQAGEGGVGIGGEIGEELWVLLCR